MCPEPGHVVHAGVGDLRAIQALKYLGAGHACKDLKNRSLQCSAVLVAPGVAVKARVGCQPRLKQHTHAKKLPFALVLQPQHDRAAIAHRKGAIRVNGGVRGSAAWRRRSTSVGVVHRVAHPFGQRLQHRHIDMRALARTASLVTLQQGGEDAGVGIHARSNICNGVAGLAGIFRRAGDGQEACLTLDQQVICLFVAVRAVVAVA